MTFLASSQTERRKAADRGALVNRSLKCFVAALVWMIASTLCSASDATLEYKVKAGFLFNFAKFVEWPADRLPAGSPIDIAILAPADVYTAIEQALRGKTASNHPLNIRKWSPSSEQHLPHILFVHRAAEVNAETLAAEIESQSVLLVGESSGFANDGGVIGFVMRGESLRFQVNLAAASKSNLKLNSQLASLAEIVRPKS